MATTGSSTTTPRTFDLGGMAQRIAVPHLVLTHLIPPPVTELDAESFAEDVRAGGFTGELTVGHDLLAVTARAPSPILR